VKKFNRHDLSIIQVQNRSKRNRNRLNMMGLRQAKGTPPNQHLLPDKAIFYPMPKVLSFPEFLLRMNLRFMPWWSKYRRRKDENKSISALPARR